MPRTLALMALALLLAACGQPAPAAPTPPPPTSTPRPSPTAAPSPSPVPTPTLIPASTATPTPEPDRGVATRRLDRLARAVAITGWFARVPPGRPDHFDSYLADADLALIDQLGFRSVRLVVDPAILAHPETPGTPDLMLLGQLDGAIDRIIAVDLAVVVALQPADPALLDDAARADELVALWSGLARHLSGRDPDLVFLEALAQPGLADQPEIWQALLERLLTAMRASAPQHTLIAGGAGRGGPADLARLTPLPDPNVVYALHMAEPLLFTHQGLAADGLAEVRDLPYPSFGERCAAAQAAVADPGLAEQVRAYCQEQGWDALALETSVADAAAWGAANGVVVWVASFGATCDAAPRFDRLRWFEDVRGIFERLGMGWSLSGYDDCMGLNRTQGAAGEPVVDAELAARLGLQLP